MQAKARYKEQVIVLAQELGALQRRTSKVRAQGCTSEECKPELLLPAPSAACTCQAAADCCVMCRAQSDCLLQVHHSSAAWATR